MSMVHDVSVSKGSTPLIKGSTPLIHENVAHRRPLGSSLGSTHEVIASLDPIRASLDPIRPLLTKPQVAWSPNAILKRLSDIALASLLLVILAPLFAVLAALICLDGGPILYRHTRLGRGLQSFQCLKFRSMIPGDLIAEYLHYNPDAAEEWRREHKLTRDPRVTSIGKLLRATSLDELPQLINVLWGDMSLVGPRPITSAETHFYGPLIDYYASVRPGLTGLWQISGRSDIDYAARVALDRCYATVNNVVMDAAILLRTPVAVLSRRGAR